MPTSLSCEKKIKEKNVGGKNTITESRDTGNGLDTGVALTHQ